MMAETNKTRELFDSERAYRLLMQGVVDYAIYLLDPQGRVANWNMGAQRIKGYRADEIIGEHFGVFYPPEDREAGLPARALATARDSGRYEAEGWRIRKDGTRFLASVVIDAIYENGELAGFAKITRDITERQKAQFAVTESDNNFRLLVSGVTDYALYMLDPEGIVSNWNLGAQKIKGYVPDEIIGQHFSRFYTPTDRDAGKPQRALKIARETGRYEEDGWRVRKDGTFFWASVVIDPIRNDSGDLIGYAKITRDITERREAQQKLEQVQRQLAESQKLDALGQLTGGVAHDFNNLLMVITGSMQMIRKHAANPAVLRALNTAENAVQRGATLTRQLLTFARHQQVNPQPLDVAEAIGAVREVLNMGLGSAVSLLVDVEPDTWPMTADATEFETALVNLLVNARDAMPDGGTVTISASNLGGDNSPLDDDCVCIRVADTGSGIPPDVARQIFDPFFTTKPPGKGTGLGLSQVHGFVTQAGGTISVASELGQGTTFTICLPRGTPAAAEAEETESALATTSTTVLLVEDNPDVASVSTDLLEQLGYRVKWAANADAALELVARNGIDVVFSDIVMPGKTDGLGLAQQLRQSHPRLPILLATGYSAAIRKSGTEFPLLHKPYQIHELSRALETLLSA